jgi:hypothetical protein
LSIGNSFFNPPIDEQKEIKMVHVVHIAMILIGIIAIFLLKPKPSDERN